MIGDRIKFIREYYEIDAQELAKRTGYTAAYISMLESNKRHNPSMKTINKIADALNVDVSVLIKHEKSISADILEWIEFSLSRFENISDKNIFIEILIKNVDIEKSEIENLIDDTFYELSKEDNFKLLNFLKELDFTAYQKLYESYLKKGSNENESVINKSSSNTVIIPNEFTIPEDARSYIKMHAIFGSGGFDVNKMSDEQVLEFANEMLKQVELIGFKYKK